VHVFVSEEDLPVAQELLMADEVESAFDDPGSEPDLGTPRALWILLAAVVVMAAIAFARSF